MAMTTMQRIAMTRAQHGDWDLADAMEYLHREKNERAAHDGYFVQLISAEFVGGRLAALNFGEEFDDDEADVVVQRNLNGEVLWRAGDEDESKRVRGLEVIGSDWAQEVVDSYHSFMAAKNAKPQTLDFQMETY